MAEDSHCSHPSMDAPPDIGFGADMAPAQSGTGFDPARYRVHLAHLDMGDEAKRELLLAMYRILSSFVDRAFGDDAAQLAMKAGDSANKGREGQRPDAVASTLTRCNFKSAELARLFRASSRGDSKERRQDNDHEND